MTTINGVYENGTIRLPEEIPLKEKQQLLITVIDVTDDSMTDNIRNATLILPDSFQEYFTNKRENLYQDYLNTDK